MSPSSGRTSGASPSTTPKPTRFRPLTSSVRATLTSTYHDAASHRKTRPISSPDVEKSHTTATAATRIRPTGNDDAVAPLVHEASRSSRDGERGDGGEEAGDHRDPFVANEQAEDGAADDEDGEPQRARRRFDAFAGVEHGPVAGEDLVDDAQVDVRVLVHPAMGPSPDGDHRDRDVQRCGSQPPSSRVTA